MKFKSRFLILLLVIVTSCEKIKSSKYPVNTFLRDFKVSSYSKDELKWNVFCRFAEIDELKNIFTCINTKILIYKDNKIISEMISEKAFADLNEKLFFLEEKAYIKSYTQGISLKTEKIFFDYKTEKIYSNTKTVIYKDKLEIISEGFDAKSDLSNIKIKKHTTKYIN